MSIESDVEVLLKKNVPPTAEACFTNSAREERHDTKK